MFEEPKNLNELVQNSAPKVMNERGGISLALKTAFMGIVFVIFIVPSIMSTLISEMVTTTAGKPLGNLTLLAFALIVVIVAIAAIVQVKRALSTETEPEIQFIPRG